MKNSVTVKNVHNEFLKIKKDVVKRNFSHSKLGYILYIFQKVKLKVKKDVFSKILLSGFFDYEWYIKQYPDVKKIHNTLLSTFKHYCDYGWKEGKSPGPHFDTNHYLDNNLDIKESGVNPLIHYIKYGQKENRSLGEENYLFSPYANWIRLNEPTNDLIKNESLKISIILPFIESENEFVKPTLNSILNQSYSNIEVLILVDSATKTNNLGNDSRIKIIQVTKEDFEGFKLYNIAATEAKSEWLLYVNDFEFLNQNAVSEIVQVINERNEANLIYFDEDLLTSEGYRKTPYFKPEFNLDLLYSKDFISKTCVFKKDIYTKIGAFEKGVEFAEEYDLLLRYINEIDHKSIYRIPKVLKHFRESNNDKEKSIREKNILKTLSNHLTRFGASAQKGLVDSSFKINWPIAGNPLVSLIIPTYNGYDITKQTIESILQKTDYDNFEIVLIDNNSNDPKALTYFEELNQHNKIKIVKYPFPFNYSAINNFALKYTSGNVIGLLNNDIEVINGSWLTEMLSHALRKEIGCVGAKLYYPNETIQHAGLVMGIGGTAGHAHKHFQRNLEGVNQRLKLVQNFTGVTAACLLIRKDVFIEVGGLNEEKLKIAYNDVDLSLKVFNAGYRNLWTPYAELYHHESVSRGYEDTPEKKTRLENEGKYLKETWQHILLNDPNYSPNLTLDREDFSIK